MTPSWTIRRPLLVSLLALNAALLLLWFRAEGPAFRAGGPKPTAALPVLAQTGPFELTRESGAAFSSESLLGNPWIASFLFTRCPNQCPAMSVRLAALQKTLPPGSRIVSFSVDPAHDTPEVLSAYARRFGASGETWVFLTGPPAEIRAVQSELKLSTEDDPNLHTLRFVLMDAGSRARGYYDSEDPSSLARLARDLKRVGET